MAMSLYFLVCEKVSILFLHIEQYFVGFKLFVKLSQAQH